MIKKGEGNVKDMVKEFYTYINQLEGKDYLENYLKYHLSLLIQEVKPSLTITISGQKNLIVLWNTYGEKILEQLQLKYVILREYEQKKTLLVYSDRLIAQVLAHQEVREFLYRKGYKNIETNGAIRYLARRYKQYHCPHELGLFLGIPLDDVKDFMGCEKKQCLLCGYWKVYNNMEEALKIFKAYDEARRLVLEELLEEIKQAG